MKTNKKQELLTLNQAKPSKGKEILGILASTAKMIYYVLQTVFLIIDFPKNNPEEKILQISNYLEIAMNVVISMINSI